MQDGYVSFISILIPDLSAYMRLVLSICAGKTTALDSTLFFFEIM